MADSPSAKRPYKLMKILNFYVILYLNPTKLSTNSYTFKKVTPPVNCGWGGVFWEHIYIFPFHHEYQNHTFDILSHDQICKV